MGGGSAVRSSPASRSSRSGIAAAVLVAAAVTIGVVSQIRDGFEHAERHQTAAPVAHAVDAVIGQPATHPTAAMTSTVPVGPDRPPAGGTRAARNPLRKRLSGVGAAFTRERIVSGS